MECINISKEYKKKKVLSDISFSLERGKIYGLIGRNGVGKTTLLSIMSAQNPATSGKVMIDGEEVWENTHALSKICFSRELQTTEAYKVKEYLDTAAIFYPHWDKEYAERLVNIFNLDKKQRMNKLSKGMLSMITIIVALASKAEYTFLDEPVAGLDVVARDEFYKILLEEYTETGRTFVVSTHIIDEASDIFEEVIMIKDNRIAIKENTQELLDRAVHISGPANEVDSELEKHTDAQILEVQTLGRSKGVSLLLNQGDRINVNEQLMVQKLTLQKLFVAMCEERGGENEE